MNTKLLIVITLILALSSVCWGQANVQALEHGKEYIQAQAQAEVIIQALGQNDLSWRYIIVNQLQYQQLRKQFHTGEGGYAFSHLPTRTTYIDIRAFANDHYVHDLAHELGHILTNATRRTSEREADQRAAQLLSFRK